MSPLEDIFPRVLPRVADCPEPIVRDALITAAQRFCERTRLWRHSDTVTVTVNEPQPIVAPDGATIYEIESARFDDDEILKPVSISWLDANIFDWRTNDTAPPKWITQEEPDKVTLVPFAEGELSVSLYLKPAYDADELPDWMVEKYARVLADGAMGEIFSIPGQDYSDGQLSTFHETRFARDLDSLSSQNVKGQQRAPVRSKPQFF